MTLTTMLMLEVLKTLANR